MTPRRSDRRRAPARRPGPRSSPVNYLILTVGIVIAAAAAATAFFGPGFDKVTPHGRVLGQLDGVADAQAGYYREHGTFADWLRSLDLEPDPQVYITMLHADSTRWEAIASHDMGLTCSQSGTVGELGPVKERPVCFTTPAD